MITQLMALPVAYAAAERQGALIAGGHRPGGGRGGRAGAAGQPDDDRGAGHRAARRVTPAATPATSGRHQRDDGRGWLGRDVPCGDAPPTRPRAPADEQGGRARVAWCGWCGLYSSTSSLSRSWASVRASSRETCIWEMPTSCAICDCVMLPKKRSSRIRFSRGGRSSSSGLSDSRYSTPSSASSSAPRVSATAGDSSSVSGTSSESVLYAFADSRPSRTSSSEMRQPLGQLVHRGGAAVLLGQLRRRRGQRRAAAPAAGAGRAPPSPCRGSAA